MADGVAGLLSYKCIQDAQPLLNARALFLLATTPMGEAASASDSCIHHRQSSYIITALEVVEPRISPRIRYTIFPRNISATMKSAISRMPR